MAGRGKGDEMIKVSEKIIPVLDITPAKRCPDFDNDCKDVPDHAECWRGVTRQNGSTIVFTSQAEGYCPYLMGIK